MFARWFGGGAAKEAEKERDPPTAPNDVYFCRPRLNPGFILPPFLTSDAAITQVKPPAIVKTLVARLAELDPKQKEAYDQMCAALGPELVEQQTGWTILRYLVARNFNVEAATKLLQGTIAWRKTLPTVCKWCAENPKNHMAEFVGWDKQHRPVIYMTYRYALERGDPIASEVHMSSTFDHAIRMMPEGVTQWVTMVDFASFSVIRDSAPSVAKKIMGVLADHFPERLGAFVLVNPVSGTWVLWKACSVFLDEKTKGKVRFAYSGSEPSLQKTFDDLFPPHLAKYLLARYSENYQNLPLGALEGASENEISQHNAEVAKATHDDVHKPSTLAEADQSVVTEDAAAEEAKSS